MTPPEFWYNPNKPIGLLRAIFLVPLSWILYLGARLRSFFSWKRRVGIPVICVGNFTVGGAGKTPTTIYIAQYLKGKGLKPAIVSRGYRGRAKGPLKVDPNIHTHLDVGDEPLMMARNFDVYISPKRSIGAKIAESEGASVIIMDDGLQHPSLYQDVKLSVVDAEKGFGNQLLLPAGPMREPLNYGLSRIDAIITIRSHLEAKRKVNIDVEQITANVTINKTDWKNIKDKPIVAFAGLAHPDKFFATLKSEGLDIKSTKSFPDHYVFKNSDESDLETWAHNHNAQLVTTEKDYVRLSPELKGIVMPIRISLEFDDTNKIKRLLDNLLKWKT